MDHLRDVGLNNGHCIRIRGSWVPLGRIVPRLPQGSSRLVAEPDHW